ncbi:Coenzyme F420 hydrogenase/dehydrogenase, beta subunit C-terminal domain [Salinibacterium sp. SYSU T00001]|uniref:Coenzyme F420 hydrogenase/dehydrogenase, beta subunit C-terminal domain n=1 Tax=Homoserinimonas sedimenticola TaxID=2986805 RepID=UPI00223557B4|nr:Coenzyme F420 hydrogenase/dehydrogenase, beta subunit C-terminal domain [Salinibacterium sedimenticola]MCW4385451.1 Coenzyme F420 hydrogenase/dehydrogenase, beta subunit C-terminal domain [Salinibacterium sedimenticola]
MGRSRTLDAAIDEVVRTGNCSGCGACALLDGGVSMELSADGYARPRRTSGTPTSDAVPLFDTACPGRRVTAARPAGATRHPTMGPVSAAWAASAADPEIRHRGSSGGAITALTTWLLERGEAAVVVGARADAQEPRRTVSLTLQTREEALASAGSRYAPTSSASLAAGRDPKAAVVGKPCEVSALRALARDEADAPLLISFFCAGTPSQTATDSLVEQLGMPRQAPLRDLWYRGRGWPGRFTAVGTGGEEVSASYDESWGAHLGPTTQWRCKVCPDGVGEHSDITAADFWRSDERGYPVFAEEDGVSALIARTRRGADVIARAIASGVLRAEPLDVDELARVQPLQVKRRTTLLARLLGARAAGRPVPRYRGFGLFRFALAHPRETLRTARGTLRRVRRERGREQPMPSEAVSR